MGGHDYISLLNRPYFTKETQEALRAELLRLRNENKEIPVSFISADGKPKVIKLPATEVISTCFEDKTYADDRDNFSLLISEVKEETAAIKESKVANIDLNLPLDTDSNF